MVPEVWGEGRRGWVCGERLPSDEHVSIGPLDADRTLIDATTGVGACLLEFKTVRHLSDGLLFEFAR